MHSLALFSNLAGPEGLLIFFVVLLLFGAKKLPELARGLGQAVREFSKAKDDVNTELSRASQLPDHSNPHYYADPTHHAPPHPVVDVAHSASSASSSAAVPGTTPTGTGEAAPQTAGHTPSGTQAGAPADPAKQS